MDDIKICFACKGNGYYDTKLKDLAGRQPHSCGILATVPCEYCPNSKGYTTQTDRTKWSNNFIQGLR